MRLEKRDTFGHRHLVLVAETPAESQLIDEYLGDTPPIPLTGSVQPADGLGERHIALWATTSPGRIRPAALVEVSQGPA